MVRLLVEDLAVGFDGRAIQSGLSLELARSARVALTGPSGCGKSTTLRSIATLDAPIEGALTLDGRSPGDHGFPTWRRRVLYVAQRASFFGGAVLEELARPFGFGTRTGAFDRGAAEEALARVGLGAKRDALTDELSEGERQRVALVRAVLIDPEVLLLDEPTSALDTATTVQVEAWLGEVRASILLVTHDDLQRARFCTDALELGPADG